MAVRSTRRSVTGPRARSTVLHGLRHPFSRGWPPFVWVSALLVTAPLVVPAVVLVGYLQGVAASAARDDPMPRPGPVRQPFRDGLLLLSAWGIIGFLLLIGTVMLYLVVFLPTWTLEHPAIWAIDAFVVAAGLYAAGGAVAVLAGTGELDDAVGSRLLDLCLSTYYLRVAATALVLALLALEAALRLGGVVAAGALTPYLLMFLFATVGRAYRGAETRGLVPLA